MTTLLLMMCVSQARTCLYNRRASINHQTRDLISSQCCNISIRWFPLRHIHPLISIYMSKKIPTYWSSSIIHHPSSSSSLLPLIYFHLYPQYIDHSESFTVYPYPSIHLSISIQSLESSPTASPRWSTDQLKPSRLRSWMGRRDSKVVRSGGTGFQYVSTFWPVTYDYIYIYYTLYIIIYIIIIYNYIFGHHSDDIFLGFFKSAIWQVDVLVSEPIGTFLFNERNVRHVATSGLDVDLWQ